MAPQSALAFTGMEVTIDAEAPPLTGQSDRSPGTHGLGDPPHATVVAELPNATASGEPGAPVPVSPPPVVTVGSGPGSPCGPGSPWGPVRPTSPLHAPRNRAALHTAIALRLVMLSSCGGGR